MPDQTHRDAIIAINKLNDHLGEILVAGGLDNDMADRVLLLQSDVGEITEDLAGGKPFNANLTSYIEDQANDLAESLPPKTHAGPGVNVGPALPFYEARGWAMRTEEQGRAIASADVTAYLLKLQELLLLFGRDATIREAKRRATGPRIG